MDCGERRKCRRSRDRRLSLFRPDRVTVPARLLFGAGLQSGQQGALARQAREPERLPRPGERRAGAGVAVAPSGILEEGAACWFCVTRCLDGATLDSAGETDDVARAGVVSGTRCLRSHFMRLGGTVHTRLTMSSSPSHGAPRDSPLSDATRQRKTQSDVENTETEGFEPSVHLESVQQFSKLPPSATRPRLQRESWL